MLIAELLDSEPDAEFYDAKVKVLSEMIKHHVKEEEKRGEGMFAQAADAGLDIEALGERMQERKQELMEEFKHGAKLPPPETRSFTGHELVQGAPVDAGHWYADGLSGRVPPSASSAGRQRPPAAIARGKGPVTSA